CFWPSTPPSIFYNLSLHDALPISNSITTLSKELKELKMSRSEFLASVSHELRTPLTYIKGYADIINRQGMSRDEIEEYTQIIQEETVQLTSLVQNLFQLAKID